MHRHPYYNYSTKDNAWFDLRLGEKKWSKVYFQVSKNTAEVGQ